MSSVSEAVREAIEADIFHQEALARDIINHKALATWLKVHAGVEGTTDAIAKALQRYGPQESHRRPLGLEALVGASINLNHEVVAVVSSNRAAASERIPDLFQFLDIGALDRVRILSSKGAITILTDVKFKQDIIRTLGAPNILGADSNLVEIGVVPSSQSPSAEALCVPISALVAKGIEVPYAFSTATELLLVVRKGQEGKALQILVELVGLVAPPDR